jgi:hypothetical protein
LRVLQVLPLPRLLLLLLLLLLVLMLLLLLLVLLLVLLLLGLETGCHVCRDGRASTVFASTVAARSSTCLYPQLLSWQLHLLVLLHGSLLLLLLQPLLLLLGLWHGGYQLPIVSHCACIAVAIALLLLQHSIALCRHSEVLGPGHIGSYCCDGADSTAADHAGRHCSLVPGCCLDLLEGVGAFLAL